MYISDVDAAGFDIQTFLRSVGDPTSAIKGHLRLSNKFNPNKYAIYSISNVTENALYFTISISFIAGNTTDFSDNEEVIVSFERTGDRGLQGISGAFVAQGIQGLQGVQGDLGIQGIQGTDGAFAGQGVQGLQGETGSQGVQGETGTQGAVGEQGFQGVQGTDGAFVAQGIQGLQGDQGIQGSQGEQGFQGIAGSFVAQGIQGIQGVQGIQGDLGIQGFDGLQGIQGVQGDLGIQGVQGLTGSAASLPLSNGTSYIDIPLINGTVEIVANNNIWSLNANGELIFPDGTTQTSAYEGITETDTLDSVTSRGANTANDIIVGDLTTNILKIEEGVHEALTIRVGSGGGFTEDYDCSTGYISYHTSVSGNWTANFINLNLSESYATVLTIVIEQTGTPGYPSAVQIEGNAKTILWQGNTTPTPANTGIDVVSFSILRTGISGNEYVVLGQMTGF
jgi:hypothetical protein